MGEVFARASVVSRRARRLNQAAGRPAQQGPPAGLLSAPRAGPSVLLRPPLRPPPLERAPGPAARRRRAQPPGPTRARERSGQRAGAVAGGDHPRRERSRAGASRRRRDERRGARRAALSPGAWARRRAPPHGALARARAAERRPARARGRSGSSHRASASRLRRRANPVPARFDARTARRPTTCARPRGHSSGFVRIRPDSSGFVRIRPDSSGRMLLELHDPGPGAARGKDLSEHPTAPYSSGAAIDLRVACIRPTRAPDAGDASVHEGGALLARRIPRAQEGAQVCRSRARATPRSLGSSAPLAEPRSPRARPGTGRAPPRP
jgi:hypothetical protein